MQLYANEVGRDAVGTNCQRHSHYVRTADAAANTQKYET